MKRIFAAAVAVVLALPVLFASAAIPETAAVGQGAAFIRHNFQFDGSYGKGPAGQNFDAIYAVRAAGYDPVKDYTDTGESPVTWLKANVAAQQKPADAAKAALAAKALGQDPKSVLSGVDLIARINAGLDATTGKYAADDFSQSIAMLGLACTGNSVPASASAALKATQVKDGGWGFQGTSDPDTTAIAVQALIAAGAAKDDASVTKAIAFLRTSQLPDGGWGFAPDSNAASTAYVVQALIAAGQSLDIPNYIQAGASPASFLLSQQQADGSFLGFDAAYATYQVVPALAGRTFCNAPSTPITRDSGPGPLLSHPLPTVPPASTTATATATAAPGAPNTGSGSAGGGELPLLPLGAVAIAIAASAGVILARGRNS
jgi:hypothetical protein